MAHYEIKLFGGFQVLYQGEPVAHFRTQRAKAIIAYLALFPRQHPRELLCDMIWPTALLDQGRSRLRQELAVLRKTLEPPGHEGELLHADRLMLGLRPGTFTTDVAHFERAVKAKDWAGALALAQGTFMEGFWDEWALQERRRLELLREEAQEQLGAKTTVSASPPAPLLALPTPLTRFFGRDRECRWLADVLEEGARLVSLTGPGGSGKTRLAIETARLLAHESLRNPVYVVCGELESVAHLTEAIVVAAGATQVPLRDPQELAIEVLRGLPQPLLVLDGIEHLVPKGGATLVLALLTQVKGLACLVTSRQPLDLSGEREFPVMPLSVPEPGLSAERMYLYASVRLFLDRVQAKRPEFALSERNADSIGEICRRLEGLPLGLELAAGRCRELAPEAFLERYAQRLHEIEARERDIPARHRSLRAVMDSSYRDLTQAQQQIFARLSVFSGGWTLAAAEAICSDESETNTDILEVLTRLRDHSLVFVEERGASQRWRMLELLRTFATEHLVGPERLSYLQRHARYFHAHAEAALSDSAETENLRAALQVALDELANPALALELCVALQNFWLHYGHLREGLAFLERALGATEEPSSLRAESFRLAGILARRAGELEKARQCQAEALKLYSLVGDEAGVAAVHNNLAILARVSGDLEEALRQHVEALALRRRLGDAKGVGMSLNNLAVAYRSLGCGSEARDSLNEALSFYEPGSVGIGVIHMNLGWVALLFSELSVAQKEFSTVLEIALRHGLTAWFPEIWEGLGEVAVASRTPVSGVRLWGAAAQARQQMEAPLTPQDQREHDARQATAKKQLGEERFYQLLTEGQALSKDEAQLLAQELSLA
ncbi:tetratricopeptide repeat protein [Armatimonas sp.]|uniref:ATP-binding protein n=1 Tax=Armatimonas sp. TaxID=1872638 RepID=UPI00286C4A0D|nr:tetratricopeptide repeat protein [Armatimonas sp.]